MGQGVLRKQSVQSGYSLDERAYGRGWNTNRNWNSTNTGVPGTPNGLCFALVPQPVYTMYGFALSRTYDSSSERVYRARRWCTRYIAPRRSRDKSEIYVIPIVAHKYWVYCIRYFKAFPIQASNCESEEIQRCNLSLRYFRNETYRTNVAVRMK